MQQSKGRVKGILTTPMLAVKRLVGITPVVNLRQPVLFTSLSSAKRAAHTGMSGPENGPVSVP